MTKTAIRLAAVLAGAAIVGAAALAMWSAPALPAHVVQLPRVLVTGTVTQETRVVQLPRVIVTGRVVSAEQVAATERTAGRV